MTADPIFLSPWDRLDDAGLLAHYTHRRTVHYYPVADAEETRPEKIEALLHGRFSFNGETHALPAPIDWLHNPSADIEWHILLHKFYYAVGLGLAFERSGQLSYLQRWIELIGGWMQVTPPGFIAADVTGRRVQNWLYSLHQFVGHPAHDTRGAIPPAFHRAMLHSLHEQVEYLCANLTEKRNHRTLELYAIFLAGVVLPELRCAAHWREFALAESVANLQSDLLPDGVHCELSTDYHHLVLKNALHLRRLAALNGVGVPAAFDEALQRGLHFSLHVHRPDGIVPSLSDGDARSYLDLLRQGAELFQRPDMLHVATQGREGTAPAERVAHFPDSGYTVLRSGWGDASQAFDQAQHLVFDCGPVGEGNHGHFDCLSFELSAHGAPLLVDPGRYTYSEAGEVNWRVHFRGTAAHNTVGVDARQQTRYLPKPIKPGTRHAAGSVRHKISGPAPDARLLERHHTQALDLLHGQAISHEYDARHERCIVFIDRRYWIISDWLRAPTPHDYLLNFQFAATAQDRTRLASGATLARLDSPGLSLWQPLRGGQQARLEGGWVSTLYGHKQPAPTFKTAAHGCHTDFDTLLLPVSGVAPALQVSLVAAEGGSVTDDPPPQALRMAASAADGGTVDHWFHARSAGQGSWRIGDFRFTGRWAHWRTDERGRLVRVLSHAGALLPRVVDGVPA